LGSREGGEERQKKNMRPKIQWSVLLSLNFRASGPSTERHMLSEATEHETIWAISSIDNNLISDF